MALYRKKSGIAPFLRTEKRVSQNTIWDALIVTYSDSDSRIRSLIG